MYFHDEAKGGETKQVIISVKSGSTGPAHVSELVGVVEGQGAALGVFIALRKPTKAMIARAASGGFYHLPWDESQRFPKIQILTIEQLLEGAQIDCPPLHRAPATFKQAPKAKRPKPDTRRLAMEDE